MPMCMCGSRYLALTVGLGSPSTMQVRWTCLTTPEWNFSALFYPTLTLIQTQHDLETFICHWTKFDQKASMWSGGTYRRSWLSVNDAGEMGFLVDPYLICILSIYAKYIFTGQNLMKTHLCYLVLTEGRGSPWTMQVRWASLPTPEWTFSASTSISGSSAR